MISPQLGGRRIIVTGGSSGIGASAVAAFVREGATVVSIGMDEVRGQEVVTATAGPGSAEFARCDIRRRDDVRATFSAARARLGGIDALVHAAGVRNEGPAEGLSDEAIDVVIETNIRGTIVTNQEVFPHLRDNGGGRILNFASGAALYPYLHGAHYSASKAAVIAWTRTVAHEWGKHSITVNAVNPAIWTRMYEDKRELMSAEALAAHDEGMKARIPIGGKLGDPDVDLCPVLVFLVGDAARFITGQIVSVDGGMVPLR